MTPMDLKGFFMHNKILIIQIIKTMILRQNLHFIMNMKALVMNLHLLVVEVVGELVEFGVHAVVVAFLIHFTR